MMIQLDSNISRNRRRFQPAYSLQQVEIDVPNKRGQTDQLFKQMEVGFFHDGGFSFHSHGIRRLESLIRKKKLTEGLQPRVLFWRILTVGGFSHYQPELDPMLNYPPSFNHDGIRSFSASWDHLFLPPPRLASIIPSRTVFPMVSCLFRHLKEDSLKRIIVIIRWRSLLPK